MRHAISCSKPVSNVILVQWNPRYPSPSRTGLMRYPAIADGISKRQGCYPCDSPGRILTQCLVLDYNGLFQRARGAKWLRGTNRSECPRRSLLKPNIEHQKLVREQNRKEVEAARCWASPMLACCAWLPFFKEIRLHESTWKRKEASIDQPPSIEAKGG
jgi:hypothetical protein